MAGRKTVYTEQLGNAICNKIVNSTIGLKHICALPEINVDYSTVRGWISNKSHPFSDLYTRAKTLQIDTLAEEMLDIADDGSNDLMTIVKNDVEYEQEDKEVTSRSKLRVETRKWLLSKLAPKVYGDKLLMGNDPDNPFPELKVVIKRTQPIQEDDTDNG